MKKAKNSDKNPGENQATNNCSEEVLNDVRQLMFQNIRLSIRLDLVLIIIDGGCSPAEAKFIRHENHDFMTEMAKWKVEVAELLDF